MFAGVQEQPGSRHRQLDMRGGAPVLHKIEGSTVTLDDVVGLVLASAAAVRVFAPDVRAGIRRLLGAGVRTASRGPGRTGPAELQRRDAAGLLGLP